MKRTLTATLMALSFASLALAQSKRSIGLEDYYRIETASEVALAPDGRSVAYTRTYIDEEENARRREIWVAPTDGSLPPRRLTNAAFDSEDPQFSPDGKLLVFRSDRGSGSVWFLSLDRGGEAFQIPGVDTMPRFSPDGKWMAFTKKTPPATKKQAKSELENKLEERFTGKSYDWMQFRFDRRGYLPDPRDPQKTPPRELYVVPAEVGEARQLTELGIDVTDFAWSPDGDRLVVTADAHQRDEYVYPRADLWIVALDGATKRLTDDGFHHSSPAFSPDGNRIAFRRVKGLTLVIEAGQHQGPPVDLFTMDLASREMTNVTAEWELRPGAPQFDADGRHLYFEAGVSGNSHLFRADTDSGSVTQVSEGDRRLSGFSFSDDFGLTAFVGDDPGRPAEIFVSRLDGSEERRLSRLNDAWLDEVDLAPVERLRYPSTDGTEIEGWYLPPRDVTDEPHSLILAIHGGPHGAYRNRFMFQFQLWAANGYGVVFTNPRGSSGYGEDFLYATWGGWGLK